MGILHRVCLAKLTLNESDYNLHFLWKTHICVILCRNLSQRLRCIIGNCTNSKESQLKSDRHSHILKRSQWLYIFEIYMGLVSLPQFQWTGQMSCVLQPDRLDWWTLAFRTWIREMKYTSYSRSSAITAALWWVLSLNLNQNLSDQSSCSQQWSIQGFVCLLGSLCWLADVH